LTFLLFKSCDFVGSDVRGILGGLDIGWNLKTVKVIRYWGFEYGIGLSVLSAETFFEVMVLKLYGPYQKRTLFWEALGQKSFLNSENIILGGDLNFSLREVESWGPRDRLDPLTYIFNHILRRMKLIDIPHIRLCSSWRNERVVEDRIKKPLDHFLAFENLVEVCSQINKWVGSGEILDHSLIFMEITLGIQKPPNHFKFNSEWLKEESFLSLVKEHWTPYDANLGERGVKFMENIRRVKQATLEW